MMLEDIDLAKLTGDENSRFEVIDIADDECLFERYGIRIPVVAVNSSDRELSWPFDRDQLTVFIRIATKTNLRESI